MRYTPDPFSPAFELDARELPRRVRPVSLPSGRAAPVPPPPPRGTADFIRWVQSRLNRILGLRLVVDGIMGPQTRSAVRSFQAKQGLAVDGVVGPQTQQALMMAARGGAPSGRTITLPPIIITVPADILDHFDFDRADLKPFHDPQIQRLADRVRDSGRTAKPIRTIRLEGHTDPAGPAPYNIGLGRRRAASVRTALVRALEDRQRGLSQRIFIAVESKGESFPIDNSGTAEGNAKNRRVEVFLSTKALRPRPKPPVPPVVPPKEEDKPKPDQTGKPQPDPVTPPPPPPPGCDRPKFEQMARDCRNNAISAVVNCLTQFGVDEASAVSIAVTLLAAGSEVPPLAVILGAIGGFIADTSAKIRAARCLFQVFTNTRSCMRNARSASQCP